jgi:hypothetical protein
MVSDEQRQELAKVLPKEFPDLGAPEEIYAGGILESPPAANLGLGVTGIVFAVLLPVLALLSQPEPDQRMAMYIVVGVITVVAGLGGIVFLALGLRSRGRRFHFGQYWLIFADGLVTLKSGKAVAYRWDELRVWFDFVAPFGLWWSDYKRYKLTGRRDRSVRLPKNDRKLLLAIQERQVLSLLPGILEELKSGAKVPFGSVTIDGKALAHGSTTYSWREIRKLDFQNNIPEKTIEMVIMARDRGSERVRLSQEVPNVWLMANVILALKPEVLKEQTKMKSYLR